MSFNQRYQSRLLNTLQSQFCELQDSLGLLWRQLKHATTWGAQCTIFSLDQIFKIGRWGGRVLQQAAVQGAKALSAALDLDQPPAIDQPIQTVLETIALTSVPAGPLLPPELASAPFNPQTRWQVVIQPTPSKPTWPAKITELWQKWRHKHTPSTTAIPPILSNPRIAPTSLSLSLQGVASSITQRHLVLVASGNQVLDILGAEQQQQLQQRIGCACKAVRRWQHQSQFSKYLTSGSLMPSKSEQVNPILRPISIFWQVIGSTPSILPASMIHRLRDWVSPQSIVQRQLPLARTIPQPNRSHLASPLFQRIGRRLRAYRSTLGVGLGAIALLPFTLGLPEPAQAVAAPTLPVPPSQPLPTQWILNPTRSRRKALDEVDLNDQSRKPSQGKIRIAPQKTPTTVAGTTTVKTTFQTAIADWANRFSQVTVSEGSPAIEIEAVFAGYDRHPLEQILLFLDQAMVWIEAQLAHWGPILQTQSVQLWQRWWPVISSAVLAAIAQLSTWLTTEGVALWHRWWPVMRRSIRSGLKQSAIWTKRLGVQLCNQGWGMLQGLLQRAALK